MIDEYTIIWVRNCAVVVHFSKPAFGFKTNLELGVIHFEFYGPISSSGYRSYFTYLTAMEDYDSWAEYATDVAYEFFIKEFYRKRKFQTEIFERVLQVWNYQYILENLVIKYSLYTNLNLL